MAEHRGALPADCWRRLFGNDHPVALEVGPGRGEFLRAIAAARPEWNFYAVERSWTRTIGIEAALAANGPGNARVLWGDAGCVLPELPEGSAAAVFVQFPDPWWKRRHFKRRVWTPQLASAIRHVLAPGAEIEFLTDVEETFSLGLGCLDAEPGLERVAVGRLDSHDTNFARKALERGAVIYRGVYRKSERKAES
ncbi:MAG: tRNA (guanosine(46)-N7)-methyltransferase TrmB [bacterium]